MDQTKKILIVEDEPDFLKIYQDLLSCKGYEVVTATEGNQATGKIFQELPDLILLDLILPGNSGMEILQMVKSDPKTQTIPVLIFSVLDSTDKIQEAMKLGATDYLFKGVSKPAEILFKIQTLLNKPNQKEGQEFCVRIENEPVQVGGLVKYLGLQEKLECPKCLKPLDLGLLPDNTRTDGHWFAAHFSCPFVPPKLLSNIK